MWTPAYMSSQVGEVGLTTPTLEIEARALPNAPLRPHLFTPSIINVWGETLLSTSIYGLLKRSVDWRLK